MEKITPRIDIAFKKIFGVDENKDLLISLINSIVSEEDRVADVTILNPYNPRNFREDKLSILDIKAKSQEGKRYNIEIQISDEADYDKRALYYWAKLYTEQLKTTEGYSALSKAIGIHILNFTSILHEEKYHNVFNIREKESNILYFRDLELHTIELKKFCDSVRPDLVDIAAKVKSALDIWVAFLTRHDLLNREHLPPELDKPELRKALGVLEVMNFGEEERQAYEDRLKWFMIEANTLKKFEAKGKEEGEKIGLEKGEKIGLEKGEKIGLEKGEKIGLEKGKKIGIEKKTQEIAKRMIKKGRPLEEICEMTELSREVVQELMEKAHSNSGFEV